MEFNENKDFYKYKFIQDSFWSICSNRTNVKILHKNLQARDECFVYKFIDKGLMVEIYFEKTPFIKKIVSLKIQEEIEVYL